jgi:hypothetical protein
MEGIFVIAISMGATTVTVEEDGTFFSDVIF